MLSPPESGVLQTLEGKGYRGFWTGIRRQGPPAPLEQRSADRVIPRFITA